MNNYWKFVFKSCCSPPNCVFITFCCIFHTASKYSGDYWSVFVFDSFNSCTLALMPLPRSVKSQNTHRRSNKITEKITETNQQNVTCWNLLDSDRIKPINLPTPPKAQFWVPPPTGARVARPCHSRREVMMAAFRYPWKV